MSAPRSASMAPLAASALAMVTKPKPRLRPSGSIGRWTRTTGPAPVPVDERLDLLAVAS